MIARGQALDSHALTQRRERCNSTDSERAGTGGSISTLKLSRLMYLSKWWNRIFYCQVTDLGMGAKQYVAFSCCCIGILSYSNIGQAQPNPKTTASPLVISNANCPTITTDVTPPILFKLLLSSEALGGKIDRSLESEFITHRASISEFFIPSVAVTAGLSDSSSSSIDSSNNVASSQSNSNNQGLQFNIRLPTDTTISLDVSNQNNINTSRSEDYGVKLSISQVIGKSGLTNKHQRMSSNLALRTAILAWRDSRETLLLQAYSQLFTIISARKETALQRELLKAAETTRSLQYDRKNAGFLSQNELLLAEVNVRSARLQYRQSELALNALYRSLSTNIGCSSVSDWVISDFMLPSLNSMNLKSMTGALVKRSVAAQKIEIEQMKLDWQKQIMERDSYPDITLGVTVSKNTNWSNELGRSSDLGNQIGLSLSAPLYNKPDQIRKAGTLLQHLMQQEDLNLKIVNLQFELEELFIQIERNEEILVATEEQTVFSQLRYDQELDKYRLGKTTAQNLELAQQSLVSAQKNHFSQSLSTFTSQLNAYRALDMLHLIVDRLNVPEVYSLRNQSQWIGNHELAKSAADTNQK